MKIMVVVLGVLAILCSCQAEPGPNPSPVPSAEPSATAVPSATASPMPSTSPAPTASPTAEPSPVPTAEPSPIPLPPIEHLTPEALDALYMQAQGDWITYQILTARPLAVSGPSGETIRANDPDPASLVKMKESLDARFGQYQAAFPRDATLVGKLGRAVAIRLSLQGTGEKAQSILRELAEKERGGTIEEGAVNPALIRAATRQAEALRSFDSAIQTSPAENRKAAYSPYSAKQFEIAIAWLDKELANRPDGTLLARRGLIRQVLGDGGGARGDFERGQELGSADCRERGCLLDIAQGDRAAALEKLKSLDGAERRAMLQAAIAGCGQADKIDPIVFLAASRKAVEAAPGDPFALYLRGRARLAMDDRDGAQRDATDALKVTATFPQALELRARAKLALKDVLGAEADLKQCRSLGRSLSAWLLSCEAGSNRGPAEQLAYADDGLKEFSSSSELWVWKGRAQLRLKDNPEAEKSLGEALRLAPKNPETLALHGYAIAHQPNRGEEGWKELDAAAADPAATSEVFMTRFQLRAAEGNHAEAKKELQKAMDVAPTAQRTKFRKILEQYTERNK